jgi:NTP pyrophosphatase (non-canonical NTP hydrolase)
MSDQPAPEAPDLTLRAAQRAADASIQALGGYWPPLANLARLLEECGEVARVVNQLHGPKRRKPGEGDPDPAEELGDALYVLLVLANSLGVDLATALHAVLANYAERDVGTRHEGREETEGHED